jgi:very-short-patch-repair endonuclease
VPTEKVGKRHNDSKIRTLFFREDLDRKLSALRESARILLQDAGLSALYCAFGFLEYYDSDASDQKRVAPLVFYPIELNRELDRGEYRYFIQGRNDEIEINVALRELLRKQYGVELPDWVGDEDNDANGHRRLNVLFTRAKKRVVVFSSMTPEDIQDEGKHWGVKVLKAYLQYARDGHFMPGVARTGDACDSEFEEWVLQTLRTNGFEAVTQFGFAGYRIDIAVRHPKKPGTFLCGVECDGATYHSARSVRERDRLRQEVLERLGWKIYRIWSTDWFRNPALQTKNLLEYLNKVALM